MEVQVDMLPKEVLHEIFLFLEAPDRLNAALVCKKWLDVLNSKTLLRDIKVLIKDNNTVPVFVQSTRNFMNYKFKMIIVDNQRYFGLFERISTIVEYLSFENCEIWKREPVIFNLNYPNLKVLESFRCDLWSLFPNLPNLTELSLSGQNTIMDDGLAVLQKTMKHLKILKFDCDIAFEKMAFNRFYAGTTYESSPSKLVLSLPAITSFITERAATLKELTFSHSITTKALKEILSIRNLSLHKLDIECHELSKSFLDLLKNHPHLKVLQLTGVYNINDDDIEALCVSIPNIEELYVNDSSTSGRALNTVFQLPKLRKLKFRGTYYYPGCVAIARRPKLQLKTIGFIPLSFLDISGSQFQCFELIINVCYNLVHLNLSGCEIKDHIVHLISSKLIKLQHLSLGSTSITDYALTGIKPDREDQLLFVTSHSNQASVPITNLVHLNYLKLNECKKITECGLQVAIRFPHLEYLNLCGIEVHAPTLEILLQQNPSIKKIFCNEDKRDKVKHSKIKRVKSSDFLFELMSYGERLPNYSPDDYDDDNLYID